MDNQPNNSEPASNQLGDAIEGEILSEKEVKKKPKNIKTVPNKKIEQSGAQVGDSSFVDPGVRPDDVRNAVDEAKKDFITIFGLFAALLIFLSIEVQVFQQVKRFSYVMGVSFFLLSAILMFVLAIHALFNNERRYGRYWPLFSLIILFFIASATCFLWGIEHTLAFWKLF